MTVTLPCTGTPTPAAVATYVVGVRLGAGQGQEGAVTGGRAGGREGGEEGGMKEGGWGSMSFQR
jgi:hypothetical protein